MSEKWVQVWGQAHAALSHFYYPSCKKTYRTVISSAISGKQLRLELCNNPAKTSVEIGGITIAKCDNHILELNTLTGEIIIKGNSREYYPHEYWFPEK